MRLKKVPAKRVRKVVAKASAVNSFFKLSGDVGGSTDFFVEPGATRKLQTITLSLPANSKLVVNRARFFFNDPEIFFRVSVLDLDIVEFRHWLAPTSAGDVPANVTLLTTTRPRTIYLAIAGTNVRTTGRSLLNPWDGWWVKFSVLPR
ncbi:MAG: hypothetical protein ACM3MK_01665 [Chitinophagales bacterium]